MLPFRSPGPALRAAVVVVAVSIAPVFLPDGSVLAADAKAGRRLASQCSTCHGAVGIAVLPNAPHLAGQPAPYLEEQLRHYRSGKRAHEIMTVIAKPLSDTDIENLAAWYASLRIEVENPD